MYRFIDQAHEASACKSLGTVDYMNISLAAFPITRQELSGSQILYSLFAPLSPGKPGVWPSSTLLVILCWHGVNHPSWKATLINEFTPKINPRDAHHSTSFTKKDLKPSCLPSGPHSKVTTAPFSFALPMLPLAWCRINRTNRPAPAPTTL